MTDEEPLELFEYNPDDSYEWAVIDMNHRGKIWITQ